MLQIMPRRRVNWEVALVIAAIAIFWFSVAYVVGRHVRRQHDIQFVSSVCPRLPPHQHQGPVFI